MHELVPAPLFAATLLVGIIVFLEAGRRLGIRRIQKDPEGGRSSGLGVIGGAVFSLFALLIAFVVSGAGSRFDTRRQLIAEEANAIGTAYLRLDLLPAGDQPVLRELFRTYLDSRLAAYRKLPDIAAAEEELSRSAELQTNIWARAVTATRGTDVRLDVSLLLLPALNDMIDITTTRTMSARIHTPKTVFSLLFLLALVSSLLAGYGLADGKGRSWLHGLGFAAITVISVYVILDLEYPRWGLVREDAYDQVLVELQASMRP
jgi:hypothetical protein